MTTDLSLEAQQRAFSAHLRDAARPPPAGLPMPRLQLYRDLVYNNVSALLQGGFPVIHSLLEQAEWRRLVKGFLAEHTCRTPYFLQIGQEFMSYLARPEVAAGLPAFLPQLAHYEWIELALDIDETDLRQVPADVAGDLWTSVPVLSPLAWCQIYDYPVQQIGVDWQPTQADGPHCLVVYRDRRDVVRFMGLNPATARLLALLAPGNLTGQGATQQLAHELGYASVASIEGFASTLMERLLRHDILLGTAPINTHLDNGSYT